MKRSSCTIYRATHRRFLHGGPESPQYLGASAFGDRWYFVSLVHSRRSGKEASHRRSGVTRGETAPEPSFRFPRRGRPESPGLRHGPEKMRSRHGAAPGRNDTCRYLSRARFAELTGYPEYGVAGQPDACHFNLSKNMLSTIPYRVYHPPGLRPLSSYSPGCAGDRHPSFRPGEVPGAHLFGHTPESARYGEISQRRI